MSLTWHQFRDSKSDKIVFQEYLGSKRQAILSHLCRDPGLDALVRCVADLTVKVKKWTNFDSWNKIGLICLLYYLRKGLHTFSKPDIVHVEAIRPFASINVGVSPGKLERLTHYETYNKMDRNNNNSISVIRGRRYWHPPPKILLNLFLFSGWHISKFLNLASSNQTEFSGFILAWK